MPFNPKFAKCDYNEKYDSWMSCGLRIAYQHFVVPRPPMRGAKADAKRKYEATLLLPKKANFDPVFDAAEALVKEKKAREFKYAKWPWKELRDGDKTSDKIIPALEEEGTLKEYTHYITVRSEDKPDIVYADRSEFNPADAADELYPGRWVRVSFRPYFYDNESMGVSFGLRNVQLLGHDERLQLGRTVAKASDEFGAADVEDEDEAPRRSRGGDEDEAPRRRRQDEDDRPARGSVRDRLRRDMEEDAPF